MSTTISVQWEMVPCIDQNGAITSYSVRYVETESGSTQTVSTTERQLVISRVSTSTNYSVEVAAVNSAGTGVYSDPIFVTTDGNTFPIQISILFSFSFSVAISVTVVSAMTTSIVISWTLIAGVVAEEYTISYSNTENTDCFTISQTVPITDGSEDSYNIEDLEEGTEYSISVSLIRGGAVTDMDNIKHSTTDAGESDDSMNNNPIVLNRQKIHPNQTCTVPAGRFVNKCYLLLSHAYYLPYFFPSLLHPKPRYSCFSLSISHQLHLVHLLVSPHPMLFQTVSVFSGRQCIVSIRMETSLATQCSMEFRGMNTEKL